MVSPSLVIAVSPYHLTTREAPAVASLQLADEVVTLLPAPDAGRSRDAVVKAANKCSRYLRLMESWRWTMPLWHEGVIASSHDEAEVADDLRPSYDRIGAEDVYAGLRPLTRHVASAKGDQFLDILSGDILKGGPDPGVNIPVNAAIDDFAARRGLVVARAAPTSIAQRAEARLGKRVFGIAIPVLFLASARIILVMRDQLERELAELRTAIANACAQASRGEPVSAEVSGRLIRAAQTYSAAFSGFQGRLAGRDDEGGVRITTGYVSLVGFSLPSDVTMLSGLAAARAMNMSGMGRQPGGGNGGVPAPATPERLAVLVIKPLLARPDPEG